MTNRVEVSGGKFTTRILALKANIALNARWSWINTFQYDNVSDRLGVNSRLRFSPRKGQEAYLVINYDFLTSSDGSNDALTFGNLESSYRGLIMKLSYNFHF